MTGERGAEPSVVLGDGRVVVLASVPARGVARLVDSAVHAGLGLGGLTLVFLATFCVWCSAHETDGGQMGLGLLLMACWVLYEPVMVGWRGQTLGKLVCGIRVVRVADGRPPGLGRASARWAVCAASGLVLSMAAGAATAAAPRSMALAAMFAAWAPMYLTSLFDGDRRRGWHDRAAGTVVAASKPREPEDANDGAGAGGAT